MKHLKTLYLTNQWVIIILSSQEDVMNEIERLSDNTFLVEYNKWFQYTDYNARFKAYAIRDKYIAQARLNIGEQDLDIKSSFSPEPSAMGRTIVSLGATQKQFPTQVDYAHYCYLKLPSDTKSIQIKDLTISIDFNENQISRAIKVNQLGYLPNAPRKFAYLGCHINEYGPLEFDVSGLQFQIINARTNIVEFSGPITLRDSATKLASGKYITGEYVYEMNFTDFKNVGEYYIKVPGVGRSWSFKQSNDVYGELYYTAMRGIYHQRCGIELKAPFTNWPRIKCHDTKIHESDMVAFPGYFQYFKEATPRLERFDIIGATLRDSTSPATKSTIGGNHDAADWDRNNYHYTVTFDMLYAYELQKSKHTNFQLNIPESMNVYPDILDEVEWSLKGWLNSMDDKGGVSGFIETNTHPTISANVKYAYAKRTRWDSLLFAAAAAMFSEMILPYAPYNSAKWLSYAEKAYKFGSDPKNSLGTITIGARTNRGAGTYYEKTFTETEAHILPFLAHAKARLHKRTGDIKYLEGLHQLIPQLRSPYKWPYMNKDYSPWICYSMLNYIQESEKASYIKKWFYDYADSILVNIDKMAYRCTWPPEKDKLLDWGASNMCNEAKPLFIAYLLSNNTKYLDAAILNVDYMFGVNPMGMCWTTGVGQVYPIDIQHEVSNNDNIDDPVPGITVYGITGGMYGDLRATAWTSPSPTGVVEFKTPEVPLWRSWAAHKSLSTRQCEFTIQETMSGTLFCATMLLSNGWKPSLSLKARTPKPISELHGLYYLP
jgi:endoglucanase